MILGVDPGLEITGYGCINADNHNVSFIEAGVIRTKKTDKLAVRLKVLFNGFGDILQEFKPEAIAVEELYTHYNFPRTAIIMGHAGGALILAAGLQSINVVPYGANRVKKSLTGYGHASKEQMQRMVTNMLGFDKPPSPPDIADALAIAICHANAVNRTLL